MALWTDFAAAAPHIAEVFTRRHSATDNLCMLGTLRPDGYPRVSPMEPRFLEGDLWIVGMPDTAKFADLRADPRFTLHTATVDTQVGEGDAKIWGRVEDVRDTALHQRFAEAVFEEIGLDLRGQEFDQFLRADIVGAASIAVGDGHLDVTTWREGGAEKVIRKH
ncbi:pyridoxamine 5'-phosphate oxidase family protein [Actinomycetospora sp. NBRC 106375]|uniref:pyridoxamine 5'-phosphate oxidase family protein n=1 Tax=Actinomycetospora sp. NBRC 106375 TaxID=3032207 RepID=UPI00255750E7|nr:pyridoxamine 5'-phosphate oxidase family protein [Actinomycetospora sp. NBRC 106375]